MDSSTLLIIAVFFFFIGAVVVGIIWAMVSFVRKGTHKDTSSSNSVADLEEIARLLRDKQTQDLVVQMNGKSYNAVQELSTTQQHRLSFTSNVLASWLGQAAEKEPTLQGDRTEPIELPAAEDNPPETVEQPAQSEPAAHVAPPIVNTAPEFNEWIPADTLPVDHTVAHVPPFDAEAAPEVKPVSMRFPDMVGDLLTPKPKPAPAYKSIAMQINDILQERIAGTPFETRGITVRDAPDHGVSVSLDGKEYSGVKEVPDEAVRDLIRSAVLEWEKQGKEDPN